MGSIGVSKEGSGRAGETAHQEHWLRTWVWFLVLTSSGPQLPVNSSSTDTAGVQCTYRQAGTHIHISQENSDWRPHGESLFCSDAFSCPRGWALGLEAWLEAEGGPGCTHILDKSLPRVNQPCRIAWSPARLMGRQGLEA